MVVKPYEMPQGRFASGLYHRFDSTVKTRHKNLRKFAEGYIGEAGISGVSLGNAVSLQLEDEEHDLVEPRITPGLALQQDHYSLICKTPCVFLRLQRRFRDKRKTEFPPSEWKWPRQRCGPRCGWGFPFRLSASAG